MKVQNYSYQYHYIIFLHLWHIHYQFNLYEQKGGLDITLMHYYKQDILTLPSVVELLELRSTQRS